MSQRSYGQFCGLARALDLVGDRWTLLVVRELLLGPARFGELLDRLPGIATNLLTDRLRSLEAAGIVERSLGTDGGRVRYGLTAFGAGLREPVDALLRWSTPLMATGRGDDAFRPEWLVVSLPALVARSRSSRPVTIGLEVAGVAVMVTVGPAGATVEQRGPGDDRPEADVMLVADVEVVLGLASGALAVDDAVLLATEVRGDRSALAALVPA